MAKESSDSLEPGSIIGILGGGQLGRMTAVAAARLGYRVHIFSPDHSAPAKEISNFSTTASYGDLVRLSEFARSVDVVTYEFENIPAQSLLNINSIVPVRPNYRALEVAQDRLKEKDFVASLGIGTTHYWPVENVGDLQQALTSLNGQGVLKSARLGYDGKNQTRVSTGDVASSAWEEMGEESGILERWVDFCMEISVIVARSDDGATEIYDPVQNHHENYMLAKTVAPAPIKPNLAAEARRMAYEIAKELDLVGVLAVEMFVTKDSRVLVNEIAPRPHNSGHWTIDACTCSQFEQLVRAICGIPLGSTLRHSNAEMRNLVGDEVDQWRQILNEHGAILHLYGKSETRPGRKMGHVTRLTPLVV